MSDAFAFLDYLLSLPDYEGQAGHIQHIPPRSPKTGHLSHHLPKILQDTLASAGVSSLYSHQAEAINLIRSGNNVIVATPSASGKSLCYNIPVLEAMLTGKADCAIYLFPTKALAQDQLRRFHQLAYPGILNPDEYAVFDGDTPTDNRARIKRKCRVIMTNPDMLHVGILPNHQGWSRLLRRLRFVVCDEAHIYCGVFGSHVGNIMRRLRRLCCLYGSSPQFVLCSATIANPKEHAEKLTGLPFEVVDKDGSPLGPRRFVFWNPPIVDKAKATRRSPNSETTFISSHLIERDIRTLVFARTRKLVELIFRYVRERLPAKLSETISPYRAGYLAEDRRRIERALFNGELRGVVATTALELGINVGDLEATVLTGYPGSISSTWQQAGRSGRDRRKSLSFLVARNDPLDQYFMRHPDFFFARNFESALTNPDNSQILKSHLLCATWEKPLDGSDREFIGDAFDAAVAVLETEGKLKRRERQWYLTTSVTYPAQDINIRSGSQDNYALIDTSQGYCLLETIPSSTAFSQLHTGAVYFHRGESYVVTHLDLETKTALLEPANVPYYTVATELTDISILHIIDERTESGVRAYFGEVDVTTVVVGFKKKRQYTEEVIEEQALELPPQRFATHALWFDLPQKGIDLVNARGLDFHGGIHALEHAAIGILPLFALCDRSDIGGVSIPLQPQTGKPQIFIYDAHPGGIGIAEKGYHILPHLWQATLTTIAECPCEDGCPACTQSPKCGNNNEPLDKAAAKLLLKALVSP
ncbi:MAG: DEAD/DEAH box helicase [Chloroflexota bacterium]